MPQHYLQKILTAHVYDVAEETPLDYAQHLSNRLNNRIWLKREDEQPIFSFKLRGAYNKMSQLPVNVLNRGVIAASAGNHAQGVALAAQKLGCQATIVMPVTTPAIKIQAVASRGAEVILKGDSYSEAGEYALTLSKKSRREFIPPYDDPEVVAGNGTIGFEILKQHPSTPQLIFVPVGGGGLIAGIAAYIKQIAPEAKIIGVEPNDSDAMSRSLRAGRRITLKEVGLFADGVAVKKVGKETFSLCRQFVDQVITVNNDEICAAIKDVFEDTRSIMEPAGALAIAGVKRWQSEGGEQNKEIVAITSGANMNFDRLRHVSERAEIGERREAVLVVTIPERPGSFRKFCSIIGNRSITEFNYRYDDPKQAHIFVGLQVNGGGEVERLVKRLKKQHYDPIDLTDNEMAKLHIRYMVGGRAPMVKNESVYRFEFPERPGALLHFLNQMGEDWNISMFHYRNHGADSGRVLIGMQVPSNERKAFNAFLKELGYPWVNETANPAYRLFLG